MEFLKKKGLAIVAVIIALALIALIIVQGLQIQEKKAELTPLVNQLKSKQSIKPYPARDNIKVLEVATMVWEEQLLMNQTKLPEIPQDLIGKPVMSSGAFSAKRTKIEKTLKIAYEKKDIFWPEECSLGFETYVSNPVPNKAINMLNYELDAITSILRTLAKNDVSGLRNIVRKALLVEQDQPKPLANRGRRASQANVDVSLLENLEIELVFTGSESSVREVLNQLVNTPEYLFSIKSLSLKNSKPLPVDLSIIEFESNDASSSSKTRASSFDLAALFGDTAANQEASEVDEAIKSKEIFKKILGQEELLVGLVLEVILLREG